MKKEHYYVVKDGRIISDYPTYDKAVEHAEEIDGEVATENCDTSIQGYGADESFEDGTQKKDYKKLYEDIVNSDWYKKAYKGKSLGDFIPIEGVDEAAERSGRLAYPYEGGIKGLICENSILIFKEGFKAGAKWMGEQGVTVEGEVIAVGDYNGTQEEVEVALPIARPRFECEEKVIVQIRKKEE